MGTVKINLSGDNPSPLSRRFWTKVLVMVLAIFIASLLFKFVDVSSPFSAVVAAVVLSLLNAFLRPLLTLFSAPLILMSFGLFRLVINAILVLLTSSMVRGFEVGGLGDAILFSIVVTFISFLLDLPSRIRKIRESIMPNCESECRKEEEFTSYEEVEDEDSEEKNQ